jgi:hypothetical protein
MDNILSTLEESQHLISEEYQSVVDDDLRRKYKSVLEKLKIAINQIKNNK